MKKKLKHGLARIFDFITIRILYPITYRIHSREAVIPNKVILLEPRFPETTDSLLQIKKQLEELGGYQVLEMSLGFEIDHISEIHRRTMRFLREFATAAYVFTTDSNKAVGGFNMRPETQMIQCWHACGAFKRFGFSTAGASFGGSSYKQRMYPNHRNYTLVTVSSDEVVWAYEEAMGLEGRNLVKPLGVSRTDVFYDEMFVKDACRQVEEAVPQTKGRKVILYAPTFRGRVIEAKSPDQMDLKLMKQELGDEYVVLIKHHPFIKNRPEIPEQLRDFAEDVTDILDIDKLLCRADVCISDYSSLIFEYSLFNRPMIFFAYDLDDYYDHRGFYYPYDEMAPGPIVKSTEEIVEIIKGIEAGWNDSRVVQFKTKFMGACDGNVTSRILEEVGIR